MICYSDLEAYGLIQAAETQNVSIPQKLSVIGCNDMESARLVKPGITTFAIPAFDMGQRAVECLLALIDKKSFEDVLLEPTFVERESTSAVANSEL